VFKSCERLIVDLGHSLDLNYVQDLCTCLAFSS
jgi:hypothetical protein